MTVLRMMMLRRVMKRMIMIMLMLRKIRVRLMMLKMMRSRGKKMMMLRKMMLRRTGSKTGTQTVCEPEQSKCTWTFHKNHFMWKNAGPKSATQTLSHCAIGTHLDISQEPFYAEIGKKTTGAQKCDATLSEPAQPKCPWTLPKSYSMQQFTEQMTGPRQSSDQAPPFLLPPQCGHTVWGNFVEQGSCHYGFFVFCRSTAEITVARSLFKSQNWHVTRFPVFRMRSPVWTIFFLRTHAACTTNRMQKKSSMMLAKVQRCGAFQTNLSLQTQTRTLAPAFSI